MSTVPYCTVLPWFRYIFEGTGHIESKAFLLIRFFLGFTYRLSPRYLRLYLVTSRKFGVSQRDSSIFFTPKGTRHIDTLTIVWYLQEKIRPCQSQKFTVHTSVNDVTTFQHAILQGNETRAANLANHRGHPLLSVHNAACPSSCLIFTSSIQ